MTCRVFFGDVLDCVTVFVTVNVSKWSLDRADFFLKRKKCRPTSLRSSFSPVPCVCELTFTQNCISIHFDLQLFNRCISISHICMSSVFFFPKAFSVREWDAEQTQQHFQLWSCQNLSGLNLVSETCRCLESVCVHVSVAGNVLQRAGGDDPPWWSDPSVDFPEGPHQRPV